MKAWNKFLGFIGVDVVDEEEDDNLYDSAEEETFVPAEERYSRRYRDDESDYSYRNRYTSRESTPSYSQPSAGGAYAPVQVVLVKAKSFDEAKRIGENIRSGRSVIINFDGVELGEAQRTVDFLCGATFSMGGTFQKVSARTFLFAVGKVDLVGRIEEISREHESFFPGF